MFSSVHMAINVWGTIWSPNLCVLPVLPRSSWLTLVYSSTSSPALSALFPFFPFFYSSYVHSLLHCSAPSFPLSSAMALLRPSALLVCLPSITMATSLVPCAPLPAGWRCQSRPRLRRSTTRQFWPQSDPALRSHMELAYGPPALRTQPCAPSFPQAERKQKAPVFFHSPDRKICRKTIPRIHPLDNMEVSWFNTLYVNATITSIRSFSYTLLFCTLLCSTRFCIPYTSAFRTLQYSMFLCSLNVSIE